MRLLRWLVTAAVVAGCGTGSSDTGSGGTTDGGDTGQDATGSADTSGGTDDTSTPGPGEDIAAEDVASPDATEDVSEPDTTEFVDVADTTDDVGQPDATDPVDVADVSDDAGTPDSTDTTDSSDTTDPTLACVVAGTLDAGATVTGDNTSSASSYSVGDGVCPGTSYSLGDGNPEDVWYFIATEDGQYTFTLEAEFDSTFYVLNNCDTAQCLGAQDKYGYNKQETVKLDLKKGDSAYLVVDGYFYDDPDFGGYPEVGSYQLTASSACTPSCANKVCGDDGCGGSCGTCDGVQGCNAGQCAPFLTECTPVQAIECGATLKGLDNSDASIASLAFAGHSCDTADHDYSESTEVVLSFTATEDTTATLDITSDGTYYVTVLGDTGAGCGLESTCLLHGYASGTDFSVKAGTTVYLVFEENYNDFVPFGVTLTCCAQSCDGKECGDDGCGGSCGTCDAGYCDDTTSACVVLPTTCTPGATIACEQTVDAVTNAMPTSSFAFDKYSCQSYSSDDYGASPEAVYTFVSEKDQIVTVTGTDTGSADVIVLEDLGNGCEDTGKSCLASDLSEVSFHAKEGGTYYVLWDSYSTSYPIVDAFSFSVTCCTPVCIAGQCGGDDGCGGTCGCDAGNKCNASGACVAYEVGDTCEQPIVLDTAAYPVLIEGDTTTGGNSSSNPTETCGLNFGTGKTSNDRFYSFTATEAGTYRVAAKFEYDGTLVIASDCGALASTCVVGENIYGSDTYPGEEMYYVTLEAAQTVYFVIDGYSNTSNAAGKYSILVEPFKPFDGDLCDNAIVLDPASLPLSIPGDNSIDSDTDGLPDFTNQYKACGTFGSGAGPDIVYSFTPATSGDYAFNLDFVAYSAPSMVSIKSGCAIDNTDCVGGGDLSSDTGPYVVTLEAGTTYFVIVDGYTFETGPYTLNITAL